MVPVTRILYPTDFSPYSNQAYLHAVALAEAYHAALTVLYVCNPGTSSGRGVPPDRAYWQGQLEQIRPADDSIPVTHVLLEGDPGTEIPRYAAESHADLIVMGTHGRTGLERMLLGSVAEQTLRSAPCSVLVIKLPPACAPAARPADSPTVTVG